MPDPTSRRVRLSRSERAPDPAAAIASPPADRSSPRPPAGRQRVPNRAATQRARRLALVYVVVLAGLYLGFALLSRNSSAGGTAGAGEDLELFGAVALALAFAGAFLTLISAPSAVELGPEATVIVSALGTRRSFPTGPGLSVRVVRRYGPGLLAPHPVESVEISSRGVRATYLIDAGILDEPNPTPP